MKPTEAAALLTICAAYDNRKPDPDAAKAWAMALDDLRFEDCREAVVAHYRVSREWIMPADVRTAVKKVRSDRLAAFDRRYRFDPPAELADDPNAENRWHFAVRERIADGEITHPSQIDGARDCMENRAVTAPTRTSLAQLGYVGRSVPRA